MPSRPHVRPTRRLTIVEAGDSLRRGARRLRRGRPRRASGRGPRRSPAGTSTTTAGSRLFEQICRAPRVLPDPDRGRDPPRARRRDGRRLGRADPAMIELGSGSADEDPAADRGGARRLRPAPLRADRRLGDDPRGVGPGAGPGVPRAPRHRLRRRLPRRPGRRRRAVPTARSSSSSSARAWATTSPTRRSTLLGAGRPGDGPGRPPPARDRPGQGPAPSSRPPTTTPRA